MYEFTNDCLTGIATIDEEHRHLFQLINETAEILNQTASAAPGAAQNPKLRQTARSLIAQLKDYTNTHFAHEEAYMEDINDPELPAQKKAHSAFILKIESLDLESFSDQQLLPALTDLLDYLARWLLHHILGSDVFIGKFESPFSFSEKYYTGIELIDSEHRKLFSIISDTNDVIHAELLHDKYDEILRILTELKDYTFFHFRDEEEYMEKINYPGLADQKVAHENFVERLNELNLDEVDDNQQAYLEDLIKFLLNWLTNHILYMDKKIGEYSRSL